MAVFQYSYSPSYGYTTSTNLTYSHSSVVTSNSANYQMKKAAYISALKASKPKPMWEETP